MSPSAAPSEVPSVSASPSSSPSEVPSVSVSPSAAPSEVASFSVSPYAVPSEVPSISVSPSAAPSEVPSAVSSEVPSMSVSPSVVPSNVPSHLSNLPPFGDAGVCTDENNKEWHLKYMKVPQAWNYSDTYGNSTRGEGIVIAQIDSGYTNHDLFEGMFADNAVKGINIYDDETQSNP